MRKIVIDHNILFAAIHTKQSYTRRKLLDSGCQFYTPNFLVVELFKHRPRIVEKAKASEEEVLSYLSQILQKFISSTKNLSALRISSKPFICAKTLMRTIRLM